MTDLLSGVVADLAQRHTQPNRRTMIRVHMNPEISMQPKEYPTGTDWELTEGRELLVLQNDTYIAQFSADTWTHVELIQAGDAA